MAKDNQVSLVKEFKEGFKAKFDAIRPSLDHQDQMKVAVELKISLSSVQRYISGDIKELRSLELAESILSTAKEVLRLKETASA